MRQRRDGRFSKYWDTCPPGFRDEVRRLMRAMAPRCPLWWLLADRDRAGRPVPIGDLLPDLRRQIHAVTGGDTLLTNAPRSRFPMFAGDGRHRAPNGVTMHEDTLVLVICLPPNLNDEHRVRLLRIFIEVGLTTNQEVVQVIAGITTCWLPTGALIDALGGSHAKLKEEQLKNGVSARGMNARRGTTKKQIQQSSDVNGGPANAGPRRSE